MPPAGLPHLGQEARARRSSRTNRRFNQTRQDRLTFAHTEHGGTFCNYWAVVGVRLCQQNPHKVAAGMIICPQNEQGTRPTSGWLTLEGEQAHSFVDLALRRCCGASSDGGSDAAAASRQESTEVMKTFLGRTELLKDSGAVRLKPIHGALALPIVRGEGASAPFRRPVGQPWCRHRSPVWTPRQLPCLASVHSG